MWQAQQEGAFEKDGSYLLEVPYHDDRELVMDVLRHGAEVEVLAPADLRKAVRNETMPTLQQYQSNPRQCG